MVRPLSLLLLISTTAVAQAPAPFTIQVQQAQNVLTLADGGTLTIAADAVGRPATATFTVTYRGSTSAVLNALDYSGSLDFSVTGLPEFPQTLTPGQRLSFGVRYQPGSSTRAVGRIAFNYTEGRSGGTLTINLAGTAPEFAFSYIPQGGNATLVSPDGVIRFPVTPIDTLSNTTVVITNRGSGTGVVNTIASTGPAFQLSGVPLPGIPVEPQKDLRFVIGFTPKQLEAVRGGLSIELVDRQTNFALEGAGSGPVYAYEVVRDSSTSAVLPNQLIAVPDANVGEKSSVLVRFRNNGNADATISTISVAGAGFALTDVPFLPLRLAPGGSAAATLTFTPAAAGRATGRLRIGDHSFDIGATGLGSILNYSYSSGSATTPLQNSGSVIFSPTSVGASSRARVQVSNSGTAPASLSSISITGGGNAYTLDGLPGLPTTIEPGGSVTFDVSFVPKAVEASTATLKVDTLSFTLSGVGLSPAPLPEYRIEGASGSQEALSQPAVGLTLASPYSLPLTGTLTLAFNSDVFSNDPAVQFATGGRTVNFTIRANSTQAVFQNNANQVRLQTGSVAGTITLTPAFNTEGGINQTPAAPATLNLSVALAAPRILSVQVSARTATSFTLLVTGLATGRAITGFEFQFTPVTGESVSTTRLTVNAEPSFLAWYQSAASQQFGSLFTATIPFTLAGGTNANVVDTIQSVSVTLTSRQGNSQPVSVNLK